MKRLRVFSVIIGFVGLALWGTGCERPQDNVPKQRATNTATSNAVPATNAAATNVVRISADRQVQCERRLQQAEQQIQDLTNELRVTYMELEQEQTRTDALLEENQNLNEQLQSVTVRLLAAESRIREPEMAPETP